MKELSSVKRICRRVRAAACHEPITNIKQNFAWIGW